VRASAIADPRGFLAFHPPPVILNEIQNAPRLLPYLKEWIDTHRSERGRFLLTGSQNLLMHERVTETMAGRAAILRLLPLTRREIHRTPGLPLYWESKPRARNRAAPPRADWWKMFLRGGYPELWAEPRRNAALWHSSYIQTYLERDVRGLRQIGDLTQFQSFLRALAARSGQLLNLSDLSRDLGIAVNTARQWLSILEATFQVIVLRPWHRNVGKRLVKTPKVYFTDTGTLCHLVGLQDLEHAAHGPMAGAIFETAVLSEICRTIWHRGEDPPVYFWRTAAGVEVDILLDYQGGRLVPIEIKLSSTPRPLMAHNIELFQADYPDLDRTGYVIHPGDPLTPLAAGSPTAQPPQPAVLALPFGRL
jgi:hypothetical protein